MARFAINVHPADGIPSYENKYDAVCKFLAQDENNTTETQNQKVAGIPFDVWNEKWSTAFVDIILPDLRADVIWVDYQADETCRRGVSPTWLLAYVICNRNQAACANSTRPIKLGGWGGLGSHRFTLFHSGDVTSSWESLSFQPYFTTCAANVCSGYCSHDIGGFYFNGDTYSPELFVRWVQFGCFSPILRTHCDAFSERKFYMFAHPFSAYAKESLLLRKSLIPYIYTNLRRYYDNGISLCRPLYYEWPEEENAFRFSKVEYMFGDSMIVRPVTVPAKDSLKLISTVEVWIPPGKWVHMQWLKQYEG